MSTIRFSRELRSNVQTALQALLIALRGKQNVQLTITNGHQTIWSLDTPTHISNIPSNMQILGEPLSSPPLGQERYWVARKMLKSGVAVRISGYAIRSFVEIPWEDLLFTFPNFFLKVRIPEDQNVPVSDESRIVKIEIATDVFEVAEQVAVWLGGYVADEELFTYIYEEEMTCFIRPPISTSEYYPDGVFTKKLPLTKYLAKHPEMLQKHSLISGMPGAGKTNTAKLILDSIARSEHLNSLLIFDIKGEYHDWAYKNDIPFLNIGEHPHLLKMLRINPFIPADDIRLDDHINNLAIVFSVASFGAAGAALPGYMRQVLRKFYNFLWKVPEGEFNKYLKATGKALRQNGLKYSSEQTTLQLFLKFWQTKGTQVFQTLTQQSGGRQMADLMGILSVRINDIAQGLFSEFAYSGSAFSTDVLLNKKIVLGLNRLSRENILFLTSFFALFHFENVRALSSSDRLRHVIVIEEAHRVMKAFSRAAEFKSAEANLAETLENAVSELRSRGVGILIIEQSPSQLIPGAIANTGIKITHRLALPDDNQMMVEAMNISPEAEINTLETGECYLQIEGVPTDLVRMDQWSAEDSR